MFAVVGVSVPLLHVSLPAVKPVTGSLNTNNWIVLIIGFVVSFFVALGVVEWFLFWVRKHGFAIFAIYRIALGTALLLWGSKIIAG